MRFNRPVGSVLRFGALLVGFVSGIVLLGLVSTVLPGAWLPLAYCCAATLLVAWVLEPPATGMPGPPGAVRRAKRPYRWWRAALTLDVFVLWSMSVESIGLERIPDVGKLVMPALYGAAILATIGFALAAWRRAPWLWALLIPPSIIAFVSSSRGGPSPFIAFYHGICGLSPEASETATLLTRKTGHFAFYGTVGLLAAITARSFGLGRRASFLFGALFPLLLACFDELRQSGYRNRTGTPWDVLLDMTGAAVFLSILAWRSKTPSPPRDRSPGS